MSLDGLRIKRTKLLALQVEVDQRLAAIEEAIRMHGVLIGRPRRPYCLTVDEARAMHNRYNSGERTPQVRLGEREYKRRDARGRRERARVAEL